MPRERTALAKLADQRLDEGARESARYCDLQVDFVDEETGETFARFGGKWDRLYKEYVGDAERSRRFKLHQGQLQSARWFDGWLDCYQRDDFGNAPRIYDAIHYGGRRGGKSEVAFAELIAFAASVPGAICWVVVPSESFYDEPTATLSRMLPREWYESAGEPVNFYLANGSIISIRSGHVPRLLKQGRADFVLINEGQALNKQAYDTLSASVVDSGGIIVTACNPPDVGDPGDWVADIVSRAERGDMLHVIAFFLDPENNPHIDQQALRALAEKYDAHTYKVQVRGMILLTPDTVLHAWSRKDNELPMPAFGDCTQEFTKHFEGWQLDDIVSIDVQSYPWIAAVRWRAFRHPLSTHDMEMAMLWGVGEVFVDRGDEVDTANGLIDLGCDPDRTLVVMDASCAWQQAQRDEDKQMPKFRGKGSMDMMRECGFRHVVPPDQRMDRNPDIADRCRAANSRIGTMAGQRFVFMDPNLCKRAIESIRKWKTRPSGMPSRSAKAAHAGDAVTYAIWRFFPRRGETNKVEVMPMKKRFAGASRLKGF